MTFIIRIILASLFIISCSSNEYEQTKNIDYLNEVNKWHTKRAENLKKENGWLNLVGLYWLNEGENTFGSDNSNDIVFPEGRADKFLGKIIKNDTVILSVINEDVKVFNEKTAVNEINMKSDLTGSPTVLSHNTLRWFIIKRGDRFGVRLRDLNAELLSDFDGIERFPVQDKWRINARFEESNPPKKILIPSIIGTINESFSPGAVIFSMDDKEYKLYPTNAGSRLFIVFADMTSGIETYGAGRFLYAGAPDSNNVVVLDFNKAYNPPCAFTKFATCPLPPDENKLKLRITAGEKNFGKL